MTKLRNINAVVDAMIANPRATTYDFVAGSDAQGDYIEKRSKIASKFRQWRGKHIHATGTDAKARYNRDKVAINDFLVAKTIQKFARRADAGNPLSLFGSKQSAVLLTSHKAAPGTYFKARFAERHERASAALAHYEIMIRSIESNRRPKLESAASQAAVIEKINERWSIRDDGDEASNAGSVASELNRLGGGTARNIWLGNTDLDDIDRENDAINGDIARDPLLSLDPAPGKLPNGSNEKVSAQVGRRDETSLGKTPDDFHAYITDPALAVSLLKDGLKGNPTAEEKNRTEALIASAQNALTAATTTFINNRVGVIPKDRVQLEAFIRSVEPLTRQYHQKVDDLREKASKLDPKAESIQLETTRNVIMQILAAHGLLCSILRAARDDLYKLPVPGAAQAAPGAQLPAIGRAANPAAPEVARKANPFSKLAESRRINDLFEQAKRRQPDTEPGTEALLAVDLLTAQGATQLQAKAALGLFADEIGEKPTDTLTPLNALARNYETRIFPALLGAKRAIADFNTELVAHLGTVGKLADQLDGDCVVPNKPWSSGLTIKLSGIIDREVIVPCGIQADGRFILYNQGGGLLRYTLPDHLAAKGVNLHLYLKELAKKAVDSRREFTAGLKEALSPDLAIDYPDRFIQAYAASKSANSYPQTFNFTLLTDEGNFRKEEELAIASNYAYDAKAGTIKKNVDSLVANRLLKKDSDAEIGEARAHSAKIAFYRVVNATAREQGLNISNITEPQIMKIAHDLAQDYTARHDLLREELGDAKAKLYAAEQLLANKRPGSNEQTLKQKVDVAAYNHAVIEARLEFTTEREAYAIQLAETPKLFWNQS